METTNATTNPQAKGRNGADGLWEELHAHMSAGRWPLALEALRHMNCFYAAYAVDSCLTVGDSLRGFATTPPVSGLRRLLDAEVGKWNTAVEARWGL